MLIPPLALLLATHAVTATAQTRDEDASPKYRICPTNDSPEPYCCTNVVGSLGLGCRPRKWAPDSSGSTRY